ncbi:hypothetical protein ACQV2E_20795 [Pantoea allii]|uniref:Uncharacterized protein n=1 Tax=Pantoea allii TaxID=574096 RepID=A0ABS6VJK6_9GAMM|nr:MULTISPECIES: hypothetical protein [Pantoea]MBW1215815.1 hypothetical protein [Pantoea allii]MBW1254614.1 hypothetical protein [Pantoea allii]MBW1259441.1 hypothetical protein [Pantoea allii]MBW1263726.1 hypothetical protein [Pantoea allii]MBW1268513.1 hypothetical protein [Pantoea allii]
MAEKTLKARRKQLVRLRRMNFMWLKRVPVRTGIWAAWSVTVVVSLFALVYTVRGGPYTLQLQVVAMLMQFVSWLKTAKTPHYTWSDLIAKELVLYKPTDEAAFARLRQDITRSCCLDPHRVGQWISQELSALNRETFALASRKMGHDTEDRHHDDAQYP